MPGHISSGRIGVCCGALLFNMTVLTATLDFERVLGQTPLEGLAISNQFQAQFGMSFRLGNGNAPVIARRGIPIAAFVISVAGTDEFDTVHPADPRAGEFGDFSLTDEGRTEREHTIIIDFAVPVTQVSGFVLDVDGSETYSLRAYSDDGETLLGEITLNDSVPGTGDGRAAAWSFSRSTADIRQVRIDPSNTANFALDNLTCSYTPPQPLPATLGLQMYPGIAIQGEVGRFYRIEYTNAVNAPDWTLLTNLPLPSSPFLYFDTSARGEPARFYRVTGTP
jgi:hypothetical protein